jgi:hypothetical protein
VIEGSAVARDILRVVPVGEANAIVGTEVAKRLYHRYALGTVTRHLKSAPKVDSKLIVVNHIKMRLYWRTA